MLVKTKLDRLEEIEGKRVELPFLSKYLEIPLRRLERIMERLEDEEIVELEYLPIPFTAPRVFVKKVRHVYEPEITDVGKKLKEYRTSNEDGTYIAKVKILETKNSKKIYYLDYPKPASITSAYLEKLKEEISIHLPPETSLMTEEDRKIKIYSRQLKLSVKGLKDIVFEEEDARVLAGTIRAEMYGVDVLEYLLIDPHIEEIVINNSKVPVLVYHRVYGWLETNILISSEDAIHNISVKIARRLGKQITILNPLLDAHLIKGERVNATLYPISVKGNTLTIRKFSSEPFTLPMLIANHTLSADMAALLWQAVELEMNIIFVGGTASGKTTMMNAVLMFLNPEQRIITIEDTRELNFPSTYKNWIPLITRSPNPEGLGEVSLLDLLVNSLRMRPDRMVVGEVRKREEAIVMFEAMHTGHSVYATFHADTSAIAMRRFQEPPIDIPKEELDSLDLIVTQRRDRETGIRRTLEISTVFLREEAAEISPIYAHKIRNDTFEFVELPIKYREKLMLYSGMLDQEINKDLKERAKTLKLMVKKGIMKMENLEGLLQLYYKDRQAFWQRLKE